MLNRNLIAVALAGALALPMAAQQTTSTPGSSNTPAASSTSSSDQNSQSSSSNQTTSQPSSPSSSSQPSSSSSSQQTPTASDQNSSSSSSSSSQTQNSTATPSTSNSDQNAQASPTNQPAQPETATNKAPLAYEKHEGFWGHLNPFARKKYVQRQLNPVRDRLNELDELTASNSKLIKDVDARATQGIQLASTKANEADMHAVDAGNRAQLANQTATEANTRLQNVQQVVTNIDQFKPSSQIEIRFRPGQTMLSKKAKSALDDMATPLKDQKGYIVQVQGFSSGKGQAAIANSNATAESVVRYLVLNDNIPVFRIYRVGMGNAPITDENGKAKRVYGSRVEISLLKNGIGDLSTTPAPAATNSASTPSTPSGTASGMPQADQNAPASSNVGSSTSSSSSSSPSPSSSSSTPSSPTAQPQQSQPPQSNQQQTPQSQQPPRN
jgi:outer membrane protein OmpA-like peptidoglycan-associated protein